MNKKEIHELKNRRIIITKRLQQSLITQNAYIKELMEIELKLAGRDEK